jgi:thiol:disulfide interchange protein DsbD
MKFRARLLLSALLVLTLSPLAARPVLDSAVFVHTDSGRTGLLVRYSFAADAYVYASPALSKDPRPTRLSVNLPPDVITAIETRPPIRKTDYEGKPVNALRSPLEIFVETASADRSGFPATINMTLNGGLCSENACLPFTVTDSLDTAVLPVEKSVPDDLSSALNPDSFDPDTQNRARASERILPWSLQPRSLSPGINSLLRALFFGLLAGLLLNVMPCVLPVIGLKIMSMVQHAGSPRKTRLSVLSYAAGYIFSFMALAALVAFAGYSWGGLFQRPEFILGMALFVFAMSLSLFGLFTLHPPAFLGRLDSKGHSGYLGNAFGKGLLATLLATPCSGPLLGGTLAWTLTRSIPEIFAVFIAIGIGMALPYLVIAVKPSLASRLPRGGSWLIVIEKGAGFLLLATTVYLLSLLPAAHIIPSLWKLLVIALALMIAGHWSTPAQKRKTRIIGLVSAILIALAGFGLTHYLFAPGTSGHITPEPFNREQIINAIEQKQPVLIQFTADWCPNCKFVIANSLDTPRVADALKKRNVRLFFADMTAQNSESEKLLHQLGYFSIPNLVLFIPGKPGHPVTLPDIYSSENVLELLSELER